jgi:hypothetical protein
MATVTATVKKDEDDTKADVVKVIKSSFEGKPVEARKAFDEAMMNKISAALALRTEEIKADIYEDCEYDKETDTPLKKSEKSESVDDEDEVDEELSDKQKKIDADGDGKIGANDLAKLRKESAASDEDDDDISEEDDDDEDDISEEDDDEDDISEDDDEDGKKAVNEVSSKALDNYGKAALNDVQKRRSNRPAGEGDESDPKIAKRLRGMEAQARKQEQQKG